MAGGGRRRRRFGRRIRREIRSARRWATVAVALWGYFKLTRPTPGSGPLRPPGPGPGARPR